MGNRSGAREVRGAFGAKKFLLTKEWPKVIYPPAIQKHDRDKWRQLTCEKVDHLVGIVRSNRGGRKRGFIRRFVKDRAKHKKDIIIMAPKKPSLFSRVSRIFQRKGA